MYVRLGYIAQAYLRSLDVIDYVGLGAGLPRELDGPGVKRRFTVRTVDPYARKAPRRRAPDQLDRGGPDGGENLGGRRGPRLGLSVIFSP